MMIYSSVLPEVAAVMKLAEAWAGMRSKDPKYKVGAAVYDKKTGSVHLGYNGFPSGVPDWKNIWDEKESALYDKKELVLHAEENALRKAMMSNACMKKSILVCTHWPCMQCVIHFIIPSGIREVLAKPQGPAFKEASRLKIESIIKHTKVKLRQFKENQQ